MSDRDRDRLESAIAAQESLRGIVDDEVIDAAIAAIGQQLAATERVQRRRLVTVLFADLSGYTAMSELLDPELLTDLMNDLWRRVDAIITEHGGRVDKHMGDAVMAVWGIHGTDEHDADRAVRAGLALQDEVAATATGAASGLTARVGINTGQALIGPVGSTGELTVMGDTVNVASRLEHAAPLGGVLIAHDTYSHVRGVFDIARREPLAVRGKAEPIQTYLVHRPKQQAFRMETRGVEGVETRTVGRERELERLCAAFDEVAAGGGPRAQVVIGEAGIGKSRVLYDLRDWLELRSEPIRLFEGRALPGREGIALGLVRDVLARRFGIRDSDASADVERKLREGFGEAITANDVDTVSAWLGFGATTRETTGTEHLAALARSALVTWLRALAQESASVLFLEDLHWADQESMGLVWELAEWLPDARLLIVALSRPGDHLDQHWFDEHPFAECLPLEPLDRPASATLVHEVLKRADHVPDRFVDLIVERSDGNPFFVEELVKMLRDRGVIVDAEGDGWTILEGELDPADVPATIAGVLQARLDQLTDEERTTVQHAAVVGRTFWDDAVASLDGAARTTDFGAAIEREMVHRQQDSSFAGCREFTFKHALLRDVTYETVLLRDRAALHAKVAAWLTARAGDRLDEYLDTIADHHHRAGHFSDSAACYARAAFMAFERGLVPAALETAGKAVEEWGHAGEAVPVETLLLLGEGHRRQGDVDAADHALREAFERSPADDIASRAEALYLLSEVAFDRGIEAEELAMLEEGELILNGRRSIERCRIAIGLAWWQNRHGDLVLAERHALRALELADELASDPLRWRAHSVLGATAAMADDLDRAEHHAAASVEIARRLGDLGAEAVAVGNLGVVLHLVADLTGSVDRYREALGHYESDLEFRAVIGDRFGTIASTFNKAQVLVRLGEYDEAQTAIKRGLVESAPSNFSRHLLFAFSIEADRLVNIGQFDDGLDLLALVRNHPAAQRGDLQDIERILDRVSLPADVLDGRHPAFASGDLEAVAQSILDR